MRKAGCIIGALSLAGMAAAQDADRPNIIFIMCDDMGWGDLGCYGQRYIETPNIDRLASQGMRFTSAYAGSPVSAPSRASLMTGQHTGHTHVRGNREHWQGRVDYGMCQEYAVVGQEPYDTAHAILPEMMRDHGYHTALFGKWAGGYEGSVSTPDKRGIDEFFGFICQFQAHLYFPNFLNRFSREQGDTEVVREVLAQNVEHAMCGADYDNRTQYSADLIHERAMKWLAQQTREEPFFAMLTYTLPHAELRQPDDSLLNRYKQRFADDKVFQGACGSRYNATLHTHAEFAAMITRLDCLVGDIMQLLDEKGMAENTLLIFTSDNGPHEEGGADPAFFNRDGRFRGLKRSTHEGGIRIPFIARWPGKIKAGSVSDLPFAFYDLMPTFCEVAGADDFARRYRNPRLADDGFDGLSILPTLTGKGRQKKHPYLYWEFHETDMMGLRQGRWKLVVKEGVPHLYNLDTDPHEDHDVAKTHPKRVRRMIDCIWHEHRDHPLFPVTLPERK